MRIASESFDATTYVFLTSGGDSIEPHRKPIMPAEVKEGSVKQSFPMIIH